MHVQITYLYCIFILNQYSLYLIQTMDDIFKFPGPKTATQMYYFQLIPNTLIFANPSLLATAKDQNTTYRLKMMKGVQLCDEMNKYLVVKVVDDKVVFQQVHLNFNLLSFNPNRNIQFKLILLQSHDGKGEAQVGKHSIMSSELIQQFKNNKVNCFSRNANFGSDYSLSFQLFIDNTRFALQKAIKESKAAKEEKVQELEFHQKESVSVSNQFQMDKAFSQRYNDLKRVDVIISDGNSLASSRKRCVRKPKERKRLQKKQSSPEKLQLHGRAKREGKPFTHDFMQSSPPSHKTESLSQQSAEFQNKETEKQPFKQQQKFQANKKVEPHKYISMNKKPQQQQFVNKIEQKIKNDEQLRTRERLKRKTDEEKKRGQGEKVMKDAGKQKKAQSGHRMMQKKQTSELKPPPEYNFIAPNDLGNEEAYRYKKNQKYSFLSGAMVKKQEWEKPVILKKTASTLFDQKGNEIKIPLGKKQDSSKNNTKALVAIAVVIIIVCMLLANFMSPPSRKRH